MPGLVINGKEYPSRLLLGTGKYNDLDVMRRAFEASGPALVTVAVRRVDLDAVKAGKPSLLDHIDRTRIEILPNTAGCYTADEAVRTAPGSRARGFGRPRQARGHRRPEDPLPRQRADAFESPREVLVKEGFVVLPYTNDDPIVAKKLEDAGARRGHAARRAHRLGPGHPQRATTSASSSRPSTVPVIVDAGVGTASDAAVAMELGCDGMLMNTAVAPAPGTR